MILAAAPLLAMPTCEGDRKIKRHFDAPQSVALAPYGTSLPPHPYAFVGDDNNRAIRTIDLDDRDLEKRLPTGRRLTALVAHTGAAGIADVIWSVDRDSGELLRFTLAEALTPTATAPVFAGAGSSDLELTVNVIPGRTPTSTWTVTYRAGFDRWEVRSVSGVNDELVKTGKVYTADEKEVKFRIDNNGDADPVDGDTFTFDTDNGMDVVAVTTSGKGVGLIAVGPDTAVLSTDSSGLIAFSQATGLVEQSFALPAGAIPGGMELAPDGLSLWVSDLGNPLVHRLNTAGAPSTWFLESFPAPLAMRDVAIAGDGRRLFALAADADDIFVFSLPAVRPIDLLGKTPEVDALPMRSAIRGIAGARRPHVMRGSGVPGYPILLTTHAGNVFFVNGATGCADYSDLRGPRLTGVRYRDSALPSNPSFDLDSLEMTSCGGFVRNENWVLTYNGLLDAWEVEGSVTGKQQGLLNEGELYETDRGELTMRIAGDAELPSDDGDQFIFSVSDGLRPLLVGLIPDRPVFQTVGTGEDEVEFAIIANSASDSVAQVNVLKRRVTKTFR